MSDTIKYRINALAEFLGEEFDTIEQSEYDELLFEIGRQEYLVLTDAEADERTKAYIENSLWTFNAWFLANMTDMPEEIFTALQPQCENANEAILAIVEKTCGIDKLVEEATLAGGRGHFLSFYDGGESEIKMSEPENDEDYDEWLEFRDEVDGYLYIYRTN